VTPEQKVHAVVFNAVDKALSANGHWVRLGVREAIAKEAIAALAGAGMVVVSADLLADIDRAFTNLGVCTDRDCEHPVCGWVPPTLVHRLRAALPERTNDAS
jgi:hypothetical protein